MCLRSPRHRRTPPNVSEVRWRDSRPAQPRARPRTGRTGPGLRRCPNSGGLLPPSRPACRAADETLEESVSATAGGGSTQTGPATGPADRLGFKGGMVIQELGWDNDTDDELRVAIEDAI